MKSVPRTITGSWHSIQARWDNTNPCVPVIHDYDEFGMALFSRFYISSKLELNLVQSMYIHF